MEPWECFFLFSLLSLSLPHNAKLCQANTLRINIKIGTFSFYSHIQLKVSWTSQWLPFRGGLAVRALEPYIHFNNRKVPNPYTTLEMALFAGPFVRGAVNRCCWITRSNQASSPHSCFMGSFQRPPISLVHLTIP